MTIKSRGLSHDYFVTDALIKLILIGYSTKQIRIIGPSGNPGYLTTELVAVGKPINLRTTEA